VNYPPDEPLGYEELLPRILAALPTDRPFVLLGESFSGPLAVMAAATRPVGLVGVILCATFVRNPLWLRPAWLRHFARPLVFRGATKIGVVTAPLRGCSPELTRLYAQARASVTPGVMAHRVRAVLRVDVRRELAECTVPILYLHGDRDRLVRGHNFAEISRVQPAVRCARIAGAPHMVLQLHPAAAAAAICDFIDHLDLECPKQLGLDMLSQKVGVT
jgi:pimeloyl-ACP methyl ester carboxylesterase